MTIRGIGKKLERVLIPYFTATIILTFVFKRFFSYLGATNFLIIFTGALFLIFGLLLHFLSIVQMVKAFQEKQLETRGMFSICRNPMYSTIIFLVIPGLSLLLNSWLVLTNSFIFYILIILFIDEEDQYLAETFGQEYLKYKNKTGLLLPKLPK